MIPAAPAIGHAAFAAFAAALIAGAAADIARGRIPNGCPAVIAAAWAAAALAAGAPPADAAADLAAGLACLAAGFALFAMGALGAGDAKLLAAVALWAGRDDLGACLLAVALAGGALSLLCAAAGRAAVPYGAAIAAGGLFAAPWP